MVNILLDFMVWDEEMNMTFLFFIGGKKEWESPPNILIIRNFNWSQRLDTRIEKEGMIYYFQIICNLFCYEKEV
jgi:hypothetical protein